MIHYVKGNLLDSNCDYICHQVNCQGVMGSGIAKQIRERWPEVYESYKKFCHKYDDYDIDNLLGEIDLARIDGSTRYVINMFSQDKYGYDGRRYTSYDAFANCLYEILDRVPIGATIGFPKKIGCGLGGGNWLIISQMILAILGLKYTIYIFDYEEGAEETVKRARWVYWGGWCSNHDMRIDDAICSGCGYKHPTVRWERGDDIYKRDAYYTVLNKLSDKCPNCGAIMRKE